MRILIVAIAMSVLCPGGVRAGQFSAGRSGGSGPLPGQVMVDPKNGSYLVYNRDANGDGELDPLFMIGPGDPEGFLYLGQRRSDGTREGGRQEAIIRRLADLGGNGVYFQVVRSHGGDGPADHNPWRDPADPASGVNPDIIRQWKGWFDAMREAGIILFLFVYDDGAHPFDDGCSETVGDAERAFLRHLINELEGYPNLIWVVQEEFKFVGHSGQRRPCDAARISKAGAIAGLIKEFDDYDHPVGVHHNIGDPMAFPEHPAVDIYVLYTHDDADALGVRSLRPGRYTLRWFDPAGGNEETLQGVEVSGNALFKKPRAIGSEAILYVAPGVSGD